MMSVPPRKNFASARADTSDPTCIQGIQARRHVAQDHPRLPRLTKIARAIWARSRPSIAPSSPEPAETALPGSTRQLFVTRIREELVREGLALDTGRPRNYVAAQEVNHDEESTPEVGDEAEEGPEGSRSGREEAQAGSG